MQKAKPTALVTGASGGIGKDLTALLAADGHDVVLVARRKELLEEQARTLTQKHGVAAHVCAVDLSLADAPERIFKFTKQAGLFIDVLVNNAGFGAYGPFAETPLVDDEAMLTVNVMALTALTKLYLPQMLERKRGKILQVASTAAFQPGPRMATYYASKSYVLSFSEALAEELRDTGVSVTVLCPGPTTTSFHDRAGYHAPKFAESSMMASAEVALVGYRALQEGHVVAIPGAQNQALAFVSKVSPRRLVTRVTGKLLAMRGE
jgi:short-subunit dehydrogenase